MFALTSMVIVGALGLSLTSAQSLAQNDESLRKSAPSSPPTANNPVPASGGSADLHKGSVKMAAVRFVEPLEGATVEKTFKMKFSVEGLKVVPAGAITPGSGHFHVIVDGEPSKEGVVVPVDTKHIHYGKGEMEAQLTLAPGAHVLTLQFADGAHRAYGPMLSQTIHVTVK